MLNILGIDPSLTHTAGWHAFGPLTGLEKRSFAIKSELKQHAHPIARLATIRHTLLAEFGKSALQAAPGLAFVEGYAYGAKCQREALGELGGALRLIAYEMGWTVVVVAPNVLKAFVTGKGTAPKELMMLELYKRFGYSASDNNDADARALLELGLTYARWLEGDVRTQAHAEICRKLTPWERNTALGERHA